MRLFQYWDAGNPPADVAACIQSVRDVNPDFQHQLFDRDAAAWFIGKRIGERQREAFLSLAVPAMQADYFRLCALWARGGIWVDADTIALEPLSTLLVEVDRGFLSMWNGRLQSSPLISREPLNAFFGASMELATRNVERRLEKTAYEVTGPQILNLIWCAIDPVGAHEVEHLRRHPDAPQSQEASQVAALYPGAREAFSRMSRLHDWQTYRWLQENEATGYKSTTNDWRRWRGSIYRSK